ncbi:GDSL-type esterase/lipase family protein [Pseudomonas baetica]|uniref:GDSL-type esterase/lipase family protein n=1 Tax=Pseudomonas baetica TaxID=674054 RepID=UPI0024073F54|nr:GDSL-type esterase/lipase family protein [Pseudomonas baetica]MDF9779287.1 hypothetical protein [Pseudomonas baetica]
MNSVLDASEEDAKRAILDFYLSALRESGHLKTTGTAFNVVVQGDSWTNYPPGNDLVQSLRNTGYTIRTFGTPGDTLENMLYGSKYDGNWKRRPCEHPEVLKAIKEDNPRFFIFSGCGNDIAGDEFASYLNHKDSVEGKSVLRTEYSNYMINTVFRHGYEKMIESVLAVSPKIKILIHGYGYAVPTGKGVINVFGKHIIGPWLKPALVSKGVTSPTEQYAVVKQQVDIFNEMLSALAKDIKYRDNVHHIDLRKHILPNDWVNELHLNRPGFDKAAEFFDAQMRTSMTPAELNDLAETQKAIANFLAGDGAEMVSLLSQP